MQHSHPTLQPISKNSPVYVVRSYAKINLTLDVLGRRSDGYHELATVMQTIDLYDTICLTTIEEPAVHIYCSQSDLSNNDNLALRAAQAVRQQLGLTRGLTIELQKRIPVAAGLAGGSSNAAAVLLALQQWWQLPISSADLLTIASSLGSDVPFFLTSGLALCEGRGERVSPLPAHWPESMRWLLLLKPPISVSTTAVFRNLPASDYGDGTYSRAICEALLTKTPFSPSALYNSLEHNVLLQYPQVAEAREALLRAGATYVRLSGSGPTLFTSFSTLSQTVQVQQQLQTQGYEVYLTRPLFPNHANVHFF